MITKAEIELTENSYLTKEKFIKILSEMSFTHVKNVHIDLITAFKIRTNNEGKEYIDPLYIDISIE